MTTHSVCEMSHAYAYMPTYIHATQPYGNLSLCYSSLDETTDNPIALGVHQTPPLTHIENYVCILCQEASTINDDATVVYAALIQKYVLSSF